MNKRFIEVCADIRPDGTVVPVSIVFDGISHKIEGVLQIIPLETTRRGGAGHRCDVMISGLPHSLYFEYSDNYSAPRRWYTEE